MLSSRIKCAMSPTQLSPVPNSAPSSVQILFHKVFLTSTVLNLHHFKANTITRDCFVASLHDPFLC